MKTYRKHGIISLKNLLASAAALCLLTAGLPATAQDYDDEKLEGFISAQEEIIKIETSRAKDKGEVDGEEEIEKIEEKYDQKREEAIEEEGLDAEEYGDINDSIKEDPEVRKKMQDLSEQ
ncbi:MAG: DUF4168 domain-containing protein [Desulfobacterales bacterium]